MNKIWLTTWSDGHELWVRAETPSEATHAAMALASKHNRALIGVHERTSAPGLEWHEACGHKYQVGRW